MHILHTLSTPGWGGREARTLETAIWQAAHGHQAVLAASELSESAARARKAGLPFEPVEFGALPAAEIVRTLRGIIHRRRIALIDAHGDRDARFLFALKDLSATVRTRHDTEVRVKGPWTRPFQWRMSYDRIIAVANCVADQLIHRGLVNRARCSMVGEWAGDEFFEAPSEERTRVVRSELAMEPGCFTIGAFGVVGPAKGFQILIQALALLGEMGLAARLLLVGGAGRRRGVLEGDLLELAALARRLGVQRQIVFTGFRDDAFDLMQLLDVLVAPALIGGRTRIVPAAFATGIPVIASATGGILDLIEPGTTGWLAPPGDPKMLAECIWTVAADPAERARRAANGRTFALANLRQERMMDLTLRAYEEAIRSASKRWIRPRYGPARDTSTKASVGSSAV